MQKKQFILIVDDTPENLQVLGNMLEQEGYEVLVATNGSDALLNAASHPPPDLILLDIMMPDMDGFEVCRRLKTAPETEQIPVVFISALGMTEQKIEGFHVGAVDYISKPFQVEEVVARVNTHLTLKSQADQLNSANEDLWFKNFQLQELQKVLLEKVNELEAALKKVLKLEGLIPICMYCKKIRDDKDCWHQLEQYISEHSQAHFSHGICPKCFQEHCGDVAVMQKTQRT